MTHKWNYRPITPEQAETSQKLAQELGISPILGGLLVQRGTEQQACLTPDRDGTEPGSPQLVIATWIPARIWRPRNGPCDSFASETTPDARNLIWFLKIRW